REALAGFEVRGGSGGTESLEPAACELVYHAEAEWKFGADHCQVGSDAGCDLQQSFDLLQVAGRAVSLGADAAVAGNTMHLGDPRRLPQLPHQGAVAPAASQDEDLHRHGPS